MTLAVRVIPCLDVDNGRVVKGVNFQNLRDAGDPVEMAKVYDAEGADELTFLDITASSGDRETTYDVVRRTAEQVFIPLTVGGGVRTAEDVDKLLRAGADKVGVNTAAIARPDLIREIAERFGRQVLVLSVDARRTPPGLRGHHARRPARHRARRGGVGAPGGGARRGEILLNSMDADGTKDGYDLEMIAAVRKHVTVPVIASGGAGKLADFPGRRGGRRRGPGRLGLPLRRPAHRRGERDPAAGGPPRQVTSPRKPAQGPGRAAGASSRADTAPHRGTSRRAFTAFPDGFDPPHRSRAREDTPA
ncbi:imidazole glycerol phosphate synthase subunit HisF [Streptomyces nogalater]